MPSFSYRLYYYWSSEYQQWVSCESSQWALAGEIGKARCCVRISRSHA